MASFRIQMRDGEIKDFTHSGRAGGSYTKSIRYETGFVVIVDEWGGETAIPSADIKEIRKEAERGSW